MRTGDPVMFARWFCAASMQATASDLEREPRRVLMWCLVPVWLSMCTVGVALLWQYDGRPATAGNVATDWPSASRIERDETRSTLLLFVHPRCPCTRASLRELQKIAARSDGRIDACVLFYQPSNAGEEWTTTESWRIAASTPGVRLIRDVDGMEAQRFSALTSGHALLYDSSGQLQFSGGITYARGHEGDNAGEDSILRIVHEAGHSRAETPVFGCPILPDFAAQGS